MTVTTRRRALALGLAVPFIATRAQAQAPWPTKPVRFIVPFPPGQAADIFARLMAERLTEIWKQQVVVENKGGGGGIPGVEAGKAAAPDGYTFLIATSGHVRRQSQPLSRPALQAAGRLQAGHQHHQGTADHRGPSQLPRQHGRRADRARPQGAGQAFLRLGRSRHGAASQHGAVQAA